MTDQTIHGRRCSYLNGWSSLGWEHKRKDGFRKSFTKKSTFPWSQRMSGILTDKEVSGVENCLSKGRGQEKTPWHVWETAKGDSPLNPCIPVGTVSPHRSKVSAAGVKKSYSFKIYKGEIYTNYITCGQSVGNFWRLATIWKNSQTA